MLGSVMCHYQLLDVNMRRLVVCHVTLGERCPGICVAIPSSVQPPHFLNAYFSIFFNIQLFQDFTVARNINIPYIVQYYDSCLSFSAFFCLYKLYEMLYRNLKLHLGLGFCRPDIFKYIFPHSL